MRFHQGWLTRRRGGHLQENRGLLLDPERLFTPDSTTNVYRVGNACNENHSVALTRPSFCTTASERVYITATDCEIKMDGTKGLQAAGAGGL